MADSSPFGPAGHLDPAKDQATAHLCLVMAKGNSEAAVAMGRFLLGPGSSSNSRVRVELTASAWQFDRRELFGGELSPVGLHVAAVFSDVPVDPSSRR